jgi:hypothetical protein
LEFVESYKRILEEIALEKPQYSKSREFDAIDVSLTHWDLRSRAPWGFVVVRATYGLSSDALWARMIENFRVHVVDALVLNDHIDLLPRYELTLIEDEAILNGADSYAVRRVFCAWVAEDLPS